MLPESNVADALAILEQLKPDVITSDIGMPGADGYELIRKVRAAPVQRGGNIPAVALMTYAVAKIAGGRWRAAIKFICPSRLMLKN